MAWRIRNSEGQYLGRRGRIGASRPWVDDPNQALAIPTKGEAHDLADTLPPESGAKLEPVTSGDEEGAE